MKILSRYQRGKYDGSLLIFQVILKLSLTSSDTSNTRKQTNINVELKNASIYNPPFKQTHSLSLSLFLLFSLRWDFLINDKTTWTNISVWRRCRSSEVFHHRQINAFISIIFCSTYYLIFICKSKKFHKIRVKGEKKCCI